MAGNRIYRGIAVSIAKCVLCVSYLVISSSCVPNSAGDIPVYFYAAELLVDPKGNIVTTFRNPYAGLHMITPTGSSSYFQFPGVIYSKSEIPVPIIFKDRGCLEAAMTDYPERDQLSLVRYCDDMPPSFNTIEGYTDRMSGIHVIDGQYYIYRPTLSWIDTDSYSIRSFLTDSAEELRVYDLTIYDELIFAIGYLGNDWLNKDSYAVYVNDNGQLTSDNPFNNTIKSSEARYIIPEVIGKGENAIYIIASNFQDEAALFHFTVDGELVKMIEGLDHIWWSRSHKRSKVYDADGNWTFLVKEKSSTHKIYRYDGSELDIVFSTDNCLDVPQIEKAYCFDINNQLYIHCMCGDGGYIYSILRFNDCHDYSYKGLSEDLMETSRQPISKYLERLAE